MIKTKEEMKVFVIKWGKNIVQIFMIVIVFTSVLLFMGKTTFTEDEIIITKPEVCGIWIIILVISLSMPDYKKPL